MSSGCSQVSLGLFMRIIGALFTAFLLSMGPNTFNLSFFRTPIRRVGAVPHTLTSIDDAKGQGGKISISSLAVTTWLIPVSIHRFVTRNESNGDKENLKEMQACAL
jgi:hypothetical protein